jgi:hypothetical protein
MAKDLVANKTIGIDKAKETAKYFFNMINELAGETAPLPNPNNPQ